MAKILNSTTITGMVPKMIETPEHLILNSQVYNKETLEPIKLNTIYVPSTDVDIITNHHAKVDKDVAFDYYSSNVVLIDKVNPMYSYILYVGRDGNLNVNKFEKNEKGEIVSVTSNNNGAITSYVSVYSQDNNFIYGTFTGASRNGSIFKIKKTDLKITAISITGSNGKIKLIKDTPLYIYYAYSCDADVFFIGRYNKGTDSKTDIYNDNGPYSKSFYTSFKPMQISDNEIISLRASKSFNNLGVDTLILKRYVVDYNYEEVYSKSIELNCSLVPKGYITSINSSSFFTDTVYFKKNEKHYFAFWNKQNNSLYLAEKTNENVYTVIQVYEFSNAYLGLIPYNDGETLIMYNSNSIDFISFREYEAKYELSSSLKGSFLSVGIDRNNSIWVQNSDNSVEIVGLNIPTAAEALFAETELDYKNTDIETFIEVFAKNFSGSLLEANVEVFLNGPIYFSDTKSKNKKIKTSSNNTIRIPVTITNSGFVEANIKII